MAEDLFELVGTAQEPQPSPANENPSPKLGAPNPYNELDLGSNLPLTQIELASLAPQSPTEGASVEVPRAPRLPREDIEPAFRHAELAPLVPMSLPGVTLRPSVRFAIRDFAAPAVAICAGVGLSMLGERFATTSGQVFSIGPVRLVWITVPMVVLGSALVILRLLQRMDR